MIVYRLTRTINRTPSTDVVNPRHKSSISKEGNWTERFYEYLFSRMASSYPRNAKYIIEKTLIEILCAHFIDI